MFLFTLAAKVLLTKATGETTCSENSLIKYIKRYFSITMIDQTIAIAVVATLLRQSCISTCQVFSGSMLSKFSKYFNLQELFPSC